MDGIWTGTITSTTTAANNQMWKEYTYGTPSIVYAPRMKVIQTWVFRRCTLPSNVTDTGFLLAGNVIKIHTGPTVMQFTK